ncbi:MAG: phosphatase PAP2 family protein, partial [Bacteroidota bacterium]
FLVPEVVVYSARSFPSGHTTSAFALFICLVFYTKSLPLKIIFFFLAVLVGFSRVYLSQHFFCDVVAGSFLGVLTSFLVTWWFNYKINPGWFNKPAKTLILRHELDT